MRSVFIFVLYSVLRAIGFPLLVLYFLARAYRDPRYLGSLGERLGRLPASFKRTPSGSVWLHAVSVGEVISCVRLLEELRKSNPVIPLYLSTTTLAGRAVAEQKVAHLVDGLFFAPIDYGFAVGSVIRSIRPGVVVILETEIWPMLYRRTKQRGCGLIVVNGRISDKAFTVYLRWRWLFAAVLGLPDAILAQTERDAERYRALGAPADRVTAFGNLKYDPTVSRAAAPTLVSDFVMRHRPTKIWIAASTMPGVNADDIDEDDAVISAFQQLTDVSLILVPRKPERFSVAAAKLAKAGIPFVRRSEGGLPDRAPRVLLLDSVGELASIFPMADVVFMGGTLARRGGHNVLEPAICGRPIVVGPHMENFADIALEFRNAAAWLEISLGGELAEAVRSVLENPGDLGEQAAALARNNAGVAERAAAEVMKTLDLAIPLWSGRGLKWLLMWGLSRIWLLGNRIKQQRDVKRSHALGKPVISVGGISMGGTGKTPFVEMLTRLLRRDGLQPAILTRGYRRRSLDKAILVRAGTLVSTWHTGDEAQIFVRSGLAHIGIGADRWSTGKLVEEKFAPDVFLLDDGYQHIRLQRDVDVVLIDALNPFPGGGVFPLGRMREPLSGLHRASIFVITRAQHGRNYEGIRRVLTRVNPSAPVFLAGVAAAGWQPVEPPIGKVAAFCGLGNPAAFWNTLRDQGYDPVFTWTFGDHHSYRPKELRRLAYQARVHGAVALLTTEKDAMNLPAGVEELVAPIPIHFLKIATVVPEEAELLRLLGSNILC